MTVPIEIGIRQLCISSPAIEAIISDRMAPHAQSQSSPRPFIVYYRIAGDHQEHLLGASGLVFARLQLDLYGDDFDVVLALAEAVRNRLHGYRGTVTVAGEDLVIQNVSLVDESSSYEPPNNGTDTGPHRYRLDFRVSALEPVPSLT